MVKQSKPPKSNAKTEHNKKAMLEALEKSLGNVSIACKSVGIHHSTHYDWYEKDQEYRANVLMVRNVKIDFVESKLHKLIEGGDTAATIFFLKTIGKERGYTERTEIVGEGGRGLFPVINVIAKDADKPE